MSAIDISMPVQPLGGLRHTGPVSAPSISPGRRAWQRFRRNRLGYYSLVLFCLLVVLSLFAEVLSNDKPLLASYQGKLYFPLLKDY